MTIEDDLNVFFPNTLRPILESNPTDVTQVVETLRNNTVEGGLIDPNDPFRAYETWTPVINTLLKANLHHQARTVALAFYDRLCELQEENGNRYHKGGATHYLAICHQALGEIHCVLWYFIMAFIEDVLFQIDAEIAFPQAPATQALRINFNLSNTFFENTAAMVRNSIDDRNLWHYPESIGVELARSGKFPVVSTAGIIDIPANRYLLNKLEGNLDQGTNNEKGKTLEFLASYLILTLPGVRIIPNAITPDHELDLIVVQHSQQPSYLLEALGRTFLVECKNWGESVGVEQLNHFVAKTRFHRCNCGVLIAREGISGGDVTQRGLAYAKLTQLRWYQQDNCAILVVSREDIKYMLENRVNFRDVLIKKYEALKFSLIDQIIEHIN